jgi:integrase
VRRVQPIKGAVLADRITAPATINRELDVMRAAWRYAIKCGMDLPGVDWSAERLAEPGTRERVATEAEEDAIFRHLRPDYAPFFAAILETGWRWGMASSLRWGDDSRAPERERRSTRERRANLGPSHESLWPFTSNSVD